MGSKYVFKPDSNPPVGGYDVESGDNATKFKNRYTIIREDVIKNKRQPEVTPDGGSYDGHLKAFGSDVKGNITMGSKYEFRPNSNPPPGAYEIDAAKE